MGITNDKNGEVCIKMEKEINTEEHRKILRTFLNKYVSITRKIGDNTRFYKGTLEEVTNTTIVFFDRKIGRLAFQIDKSLISIEECDK